MTRKPHSLLCALLLGVPLMLGCATILGDYELVGQDGAGGASGVSNVSVGSGVSVLTNAGVFAGVGGSFPFTSSTSQITVSNSSGGGAPMDPADMDPCGSGSTISMRDNFNDSQTNPNWTLISPNDHIKAVQATSHLQITTDGANGVNGGYHWAASARSLFGCHISAEVNKVASESGSVMTMFNLVTSADPAGMTNLIRMSQNGPNLEVLIRIDGNDAPKFVMPYASSMRWWRVRERAGRVIFEVSEDSKAWMKITDSPAPPFISAIRPQLFVGATAPDSPGGTATFFNFNAD